MKSIWKAMEWESSLNISDDGNDNYAFKCIKIVTSSYINSKSFYIEKQKIWTQSQILKWNDKFRNKFAVKISAYFEQ